MNSQIIIASIALAMFCIVTAKPAAEPSASAKPLATATADAGLDDFDSSSDYYRLLNRGSNFGSSPFVDARSVYFRKGSNHALRSLTGFGVAAPFRGSFGDYISPSGFQSISPVGSSYPAASNHIAHAAQAAQAAHTATLAAQAAQAAKYRGLSAANVAIANQVLTNQYYNSLYKNW